jgi:hypothetical protein
MMMRKNVRIAGAAMLLAACMAFTGCGQEPAPEPEFTASEFTISAENAMSELNITPAFASSSDKAVAVAEIVEGGVTITSKGKGARQHQ